MHLVTCEACRKLVNIELEALLELPKPEKSANKMLRTAQLKLTIYDMLQSYVSYNAWYAEQIMYYSSTLSLLAIAGVEGLMTAAIHTIFTVFGITVVTLIIHAFRKDVKSWKNGF